MFLREEGIANSMIDTSDGLVVDLQRILNASGRGAVIDLSGLDVDEGCRDLARDFGYSWEEVALYGGEDYLLLFSVSPEREGKLSAWKGVSRLFRIGTVTEERGIVLRTEKGDRVLTGVGGPSFHHFKKEDAKGN